MLRPEQDSNMRPTGREANPNDAPQQPTTLTCSNSRLMAAGAT